MPTTRELGTPPVPCHTRARPPGSNWCPSLAQSPLGEGTVFVMRDTIQDSARNAAVIAHREQADHLQMQAVAALVNDMNGWHCREQQQKCMAALQEIHEHLRVIEDEMPPLLTDVRPVLLEVAIGQPSVDYWTLLAETVHPNSVEVRRILLQTAVDAVAFIEAIDEVPAHKPAAGDTAESATQGWRAVVRPPRAPQRRRCIRDDLRRVHHGLMLDKPSQAARDSLSPSRGVREGAGHDRGSPTGSARPCAESFAGRRVSSRGTARCSSVSATASPRSAAGSPRSNS